MSLAPIFVLPVSKLSVALPRRSSPLLRDAAHYWALNDRGLLAKDAIGSADGTLTSMAGESNWAGTPQGIGLKFDGTNDRVLIPSVSNTGACTFAAWLNFSATPNCVIAGDNTDYYLYLDSTTIYFRSGAFVSAAHGGLTLGAIYHIVVTRDANNLVTWYKNGVALGTATRAGNVVALALGAYPNATFPFNGVMYQAAHWNRNLLSGEVAELYGSPFVAFRQNSVIIYGVSLAGRIYGPAAQIL